MNIEDLQAICINLPGVTQDIKWENHLCFNVGNKIFLITSPDTVPVTASFKLVDEEFDELAGREGFKPSPYLARYKWIYVDNINLLTKKEWEVYIGQAYLLISSKLSIKIKKKIKLAL